MLDAAKLKEILKEQYGINNEEEFNTAVEEMPGIDIGLFSMPLTGRSAEGGQKTEAKAVA